ncbi:ABC-type nitrate/sulfonate/bicarbonate transport systems periplasmic components-like protein [Candidatus Moduliflexus flocculans]|uniref:ABC-type nitrate/sulfonate/bicarbonate transport systems periplasmic components-like protein n=1 Tax=Candidatus Moduliflexus flocculans TaxID=1499966 RepID=A0A081BN90_9BACT|nr:ABC-type nitrate/sulfonate/bicarbonate transport systems periplasmic components-like protein [Candidatus Moduliflexus flocculans]
MMKTESFPFKLLIAGLAMLSAIMAVSFFWITAFSPIMENVSLGGARSLSISLIIIAQEQGFFTHEGVDLFFQEYPSGSLALDALCEQQLDLAVAAETPVVFKSFARDDVRIVASLFSAYNDPKVIARKTSGIEKPTDLRGKRIGTTPQGQSTHYFLHLFLTKYGLSEQDVALSLACPEKLRQDFISGKLDAISLFEPYISELADAYSSETILFSEPGLYLKHALLMTSAHFTEQRPQAIQKVLRALMRANDFARQQPERARQIVVRALAISVPEVRELWADTVLEVSLGQSLLLSLENEAKWGIANRVTDHKTIPNYLQLISVEGLKSVAPESVTIYSVSE